ncbi:MAG TPA: phytoene/squalene synthase family protein [Beijerinckiaceae bacterium]|nr:phytoene/squalene synthase family protein [Beijerinckiaceae bacterium]
MSADPADEKRARDDAHCEDLVRRGDYDRWLTSLFAPAEKRPRLLSLYAFNLEIARVRDLISEPRLGEIRMQWWRDALEGEPSGESMAHPVAAGLFETIARFNLPRKPFVDLIAARAFDLWDDPMPTLSDLEGYCGETSSSLMRLASLVLADGADPGGADATGHAGVAYATTGILRALPWHTARGQIYIPGDVLARYGVAVADLRERKTTPALHEALGELRMRARDHLAKARSCLDQMAQPARPALAPLALVEPYLRVMERRGYDPFATAIDLPSWRKVMAVWLGAGKLAKSLRASGR